MSMAKDQLVSNARLFRATVDNELDKFILHHPFTGRKWKPPYVADFASEQPSGTSSNSSKKKKKVQSTKTLADVVEALIGASFIDGGIDKAMHCISLLITPIDTSQKWITPPEGLEILRKENRPEVAQTTMIRPVEAIIGYEFTFDKGILLEALTHGSFMGPSPRSLERLEFVGDAILDQLIVERLFDYKRDLSHDQMHLYKTAVVNSDFLAFVVLDQYYNEERANVSKNGSMIEMTVVRQSLWRYMRHSSTTLGIDALATENRHAELRGAIRKALDTADRYPWALLARLEAKKFFSDLFESILCAIWIDSGKLETCRDFLKRLGVIDYLMCLVDRGVNVMHPKGELSQLAGDQRVKYVVSTRESKDVESLRKEYLCDVMVGNVCFASVDQGVNREEVCYKAAEAAVKKWNSRAH